MRSKIQPALVGLFVFGGLVLFLAGLLAFGGLRWLQPSQKAVVYFNEPLTGLSAGAPVTFRGIEIGSVSRMAIQGDPETFSVVMPVFLRIRPDDITFANGEGAKRLDLDRLVQNGLKAQLRPRSLLTGQMAVQLDFFPDEPVNLYEGGAEVTEIPSRASDLRRARRALEAFPWEDTLETAVATLESIARLSRTLESEFDGLGASVNTTLEESRALMSRARQTLGELEQDADRAVARVAALSDEGRTQMKDRGEELSRVLERSVRVMEQTERVANNLEDVTDPRSPERDDLRTALRELTGATAALRRFMETVERKPNALLFDDGGDQQ